ncbi:NAD-dependent epimerase/dehydratase family protein [Granulicoccus phenolivorans]|uniref:NAD-dependent epimerase/dehydratase family protein n=1 Tax=Granulicoccus phenolivorans TaxID=266854 RepID=UPI00041874D5|nr:NAD-dependent epimerase/dehydratase family protein [Granulicoccus phenolivorans]
MRILVTGAAGFIGHRLTAALRRAGHRVTALDALRGDPGTLEVRRRRLGRLGGHVVDLARDPLDPWLNGIDAVAHLAGATGVRSSFGTGWATAVRDNVTATGRLAEAAAGRARLVLASSSSVYGTVASGLVGEDAPQQPHSPYGASKVAAEAAVQAYRHSRGLEAVILRYFTVYGPGQRPDMAIARFLAAAGAGRPLEVYGDGSQTRAYTYVDDVVAATTAALTRPGIDGGVCNVAGTEAVTVAEVAALIAETLRYPLEIVARAPAEGDVARTAADLSRAAQVLGWTPRVGLAEGIAAQAAAAGLTGVRAPAVGQ